MKSIIALAVFSLCAINSTFAADEKKAASESKPAKCCAEAAKDGKACSHGCCVDAAKDGKNCTECGGSGTTEKKK